jgi:hypothetical protein
MIIIEAQIKTIITTQTKPNMSIVISDADLLSLVEDKFYQVDVQYWTNPKAGYHPIPQSARRILTPTLYHNFIIFYHMMYHARGGCRQPRLRFFTWSSDLKTKLTIELCMSNNNGADDMLVVTCRTMDKVNCSTYTTQSFLLQNSHSDDFVRKDYRVWFDFDGRPDLTNTWSFIGLNALGQDFTELFTSKLAHSFKITDHALNESFE